MTSPEGGGNWTEGPASGAGGPATEIPAHQPSCHRLWTVTEAVSCAALFGAGLAERCRRAGGACVAGLCVAGACVGGLCLGGGCGGGGWGGGLCGAGVCAGGSCPVEEPAVYAIGRCAIARRSSRILGSS